MRALPLRLLALALGSAFLLAGFAAVPASSQMTVQSCVPGTPNDPHGNPCKPPPNCSCPAYNTTLELNTGTASGAKQPYGAIDPDWTVTSSPSGPGSAYSIVPHSTWVPDTAFANWVNADRSGNGQNLPQSHGTYTYRVTFSAPAGATGWLSMSTSVDDEADFYLNGVLIGGIHTAGAWTTYTSLTWSGALLSGTNTLTAVVANSGGNVHGLFVEASLHITAPGHCPPITRNLSTGVAGAAFIPAGAADDEWYVVTYPTQTTIGPFGAYVANPAVGWATPAGARWIHPFAAGTGATGTAPAGDYVYAIDFTLPCIPKCGNIRLDLLYTADENVKFSLNGLPVGGAGSPAWGSVNSLTHNRCHGFVTGTNHLYAHVENVALWTGLAVRGTLTIVI